MVVMPKNRLRRLGCWKPSRCNSPAVSTAGARSTTASFRCTVYAKSLMTKEAPMTVEGQAEQMIEWLIDQGARSIPTQRATTYLTAALTRAVAQTWQTAAEDVILSVEDSEIGRASCRERV